MARFITISNSNTVNSGKRKRTISQPKTVGRFTATFMLGALICTSGVMYIFQINKLATKGYEIRRQEKIIEELRQEHESLKIRAAELKSIYYIETNKENMQMKKPGEVSYIEIENPVALKE